MENNKLVTVYENNEPLADSREIADKLGIEHQNFFEMIKDYQEEVSRDFGLIRFQTDKTTKDQQGRGRPQSYALLTEDQSYVYLAYSKNTEQARTCKRLLVKAFAEARARLVKPIYALPLDSFIDQLRMEIYQKQEAVSHLEQASLLLTGEVPKRLVGVNKPLKTPQSEIIRLINKFEEQGKPAPTIRELMRYLKKYNPNTIKSTVASMMEDSVLKKEKIGKAVRYSLA
jgi:phage regulator Rha-like protein